MLQVTVNDKNTFSIKPEDGIFLINDLPVDLPAGPAGWDIAWQANGLISILYNGKSYTAVIEKTDQKTKEITLRVNGQLYKTTIREPIDMLLKNMGMDLKSMQKAEPVKAPMPGMILKVLVTPGQQVNKGDALVILEAMKMENILKATASATVRAVRVGERTAVEKGTVLIEME